jgi:excisionase family DNA binding protein
MNTDNRIEPLFVRLSEAARLLSMSRSSAYEALRNGALPAVRIDGKWCVALSPLKKLAEEAAKANDH